MKIQFGQIARLSPNQKNADKSVYGIAHSIFDLTRDSLVIDVPTLWHSFISLYQHFILVPGL